MRHWPWLFTSSAQRKLDRRKLEVEKSGILDENWYFQQNEDVRSSGMTALDHFSQYGLDEGRPPRDNFFLDAYLLERPAEPADQRSAILLVLARGDYLAYENTVEARKADLAKSFDPAEYVIQHPDVTRAGIDPFEHYCRYGYLEGRTFFKQSETVNITMSEPLPLIPPEPIERSGSDPESFPDLLRTSGLFDARWYLRTYPDIRRAGVDPESHYVGFGRHEARNPGPGFDAREYAARYDDVALSGLSEIEHYLRIGRDQKYNPLGIPPYERWISSFDFLSDVDLEYIRSDTSVGAMGIDILIIEELFDDAQLKDFVDSLIKLVHPVRNVFFVQDVKKGRSSEEALALFSDSVVVSSFESVSAFAENLVSGDLASALIVPLRPVRLREHFTYCISRAIQEDVCEIVYSDADHLVNDERVRPRFKSEFSSINLIKDDLIGGVVTFRGSTLERFARDLSHQGDSGVSKLASQVIIENGSRSNTRRVPFILYHELSGAGDKDRQAYLGQLAGQRTSPILEGIQEWPSVEIIIPTRDGVGFLMPCIASIIDKTTYPNDRLRIAVVDNRSSKPETEEFLGSLSKEPRVRILFDGGGFNYSRINNIAAYSSSASILVLMNNDTTIIDPDWLKKMVSHAGRLEVGVVGCKLLYPDDTIQHGGIVLGVSGVAGHRHVGLTEGELASDDHTRDMTAMTGACIAIRREVFQACSGFDEALEVAFNDIDLCIKALELGLRNIYISEPLLYHHESKSRGLDDTEEKEDRNIREAAYVISKFKSYFLNDPSYNPNLSLSKLDDLSFPPRVVRPWRKSSRRGSILLLSSTHRVGYGVPVALKRQADALREEGFDVTVGGPTSRDDTNYECRRVRLMNELEAADFVVRNGFDCVISHTPPFFSIAEHVGGDVVTYMLDYGEPSPEWFPDHAERRAVDRRKRKASAYSTRVFAISKAIYNQQFRRDAIVARIGSSHLGRWSSEKSSVRQYLRESAQLEGKFVVLNVCRFHQQERNYKGVDRYIKTRQEFQKMFPSQSSKCVFMIVGRGNESDLDYVVDRGLQAAVNVSDAEMLNYYIKADCYMNFSRWEGYNLGIGQALAMGLPVISSDIEAHREFGIETYSEIMPACLELARLVDQWQAGLDERRPLVEDWSTFENTFVDYVKRDIIRR